MAHEIGKFTLENLAKMDSGRIAIAFEQACKRVALDCEDRPVEKKARKVVLELEFEPVTDASGLCEQVNTRIQVKENLPARKSKIYDLGLRRGGMLTVNLSDPESHDQQVLDLEDGR